VGRPGLDPGTLGLMNGTAASSLDTKTSDSLAAPVLLVGQNLARQNSYSRPANVGDDKEVHQDSAATFNIMSIRALIEVSESVEPCHISGTLCLYPWGYMIYWSCGEETSF
jgi:hypothetical protein